MANELHLYTTFIGDYTTSDMAGETWQFGLRHTLVYGNIDPIGDLPDNLHVVPDTIQRVEDHWNISGNWQIDHDASSTEHFHADDWLNDQVAPAITAFMGASFIASACRLLQIKCFPIGTNGKAVPAPPYAQGSPVVLEWTSSKPQGSDGNQLPPQTSIVVSTRTTQLGRRGRGRFYLPPFGQSSSATGRLPAGRNATVAAAAVSLMNGLTYSGPSGVDWSIAPAVIGAPWNQYALINECRVDDVFDTQRRRRRSLASNWASDTV